MIRICSLWVGHTIYNNFNFQHKQTRSDMLNKGIPTRDDILAGAVKKSTAAGADEESTAARAEEESTPAEAEETLNEKEIGDEPDTEEDAIMINQRKERHGTSGAITNVAHHDYHFYDGPVLILHSGSDLSSLGNLFRTGKSISFSFRTPHIHC